jgi:hypothetical protein
LLLERDAGRFCVMRLLLTLILALFALPAFAQGWDRYDDARFGYGVDIPPGFTMQDGSDTGGGRTYAASGKPTYLVIWGSYLDADFEGEVAQRMTWDEGEAWNISFQATTPRWASWSAVKGSRILHQRMIQLCDGSSYAAFRAEYSVVDASVMDEAVERMVGSLRGNC